MVERIVELANIQKANPKDANARETAEAVQENVKEKVQTMTGNAISEVNVYIADVVIEEE